MMICGFYCIAFIEYMLTGKTLLDYINSSFPTGYKKNGKTKYKYFKDKYLEFRLKVCGKYKYIYIYIFKYLN